MSICKITVHYTNVASLIIVTSYSMAATGRVRERVRQVRIDSGVFNRRRGRERTTAVAIHTSTNKVTIIDIHCVIIGIYADVGDYSMTALALRVVSI